VLTPGDDHRAFVACRASSTTTSPITRWPHCKLVDIAQGNAARVAAEKMAGRSLGNGDM
jgi:hypothetical protein